MSINITIGDIIVWLIVGACVGTAVGAVIKRKKEGFGKWTNIGIGLVGALIGGFLFEVLKIDLGIGHIAISFQDLIAAAVGSIIFIGILWYIKRRKSKRQAV